MLNPKDIRFPLTLEALTAFQEKAMGRKASPMERELFQDVADMANTAFHAGCVGDADTVQALLDAVAAVDTSPDTRALCGLCRGWILEGAKRGFELMGATCGPLPS